MRLPKGIDSGVDVELVRIGDGAGEPVDPDPVVPTDGAK